MNPFSFLKFIFDIKRGKIASLQQIEKRGLLAVKIAQHLALRVDFFDPEICMKLSQLFSQESPALSLPLESLLKSSDRKSFLSVDEKPLASASVGQVHQAMLLDQTEIILKFIKADYEKSLKEDVVSLTKLFKVAQWFSPELKNIFDPIAILEYIKEYTLAELDLQGEIEGQLRLEQLKDDSKSFYDLSKLTFPKHYRELSHPKMLVSEFVKGETFKSLMNQKKMTYEMVLDLFKIHGFYIFYYGEFHGDLHPGNIIYTPEKKICFLDCATISKSSPSIRMNLLKFFNALSEYNYKEAAFYIHEMAILKLASKEYAAFEVRFLELYKDFKGKSVSEVSLTKQMMDTIKLAIRSGMSFDQSMFPIIKSLSYLDGMVLAVNPSAHVIEDMKSSVKELMCL